MAVVRGLRIISSLLCWIQACNSLQSNTLALRNPIRIVTILDPPYLSLRPGLTSDEFKGNDLFEGYCKDVAELVMAKLGLPYEMHLVKDSSYGRRVGTENFTSWTGIIGEIVNNEAELGISSMSITAERASVVDFSLPFIQLRLGILLKAPSVELREPGPFHFLDPMTPLLWSTFILVTILLFVLLYVIERLILHHADPRKPRSKIFIGSPRTKAGRWVLTTVIAYIVTFMAAYTANYVGGDLNSQKMEVIKGLEDLVTQKEIQYTVVKDGSTAAFLMNSPNPTHIQLYRNMKKDETFTSSTNEGIRRVLNGSNAFITEEVSALYAVSQNCDLSMAPFTFGPLKAFGIAVRRGLNLLKPINLAILELSENGDLEGLERKWWKTDRKCSTAPAFQRVLQPRRLKTTQLNLENMPGIFYVLLPVLLASIAVALIEIKFPRQKSFQIFSCFGSDKERKEDVPPAIPTSEVMEEIPLSELRS